jgi:hypothetical protein
MLVGLLEKVDFGRGPTFSTSDDTMPRLKLLRYTMINHLLEKVDLSQVHKRQIRNS